MDPIVGWKAKSNAGVHADVLSAYEREFVAEVYLVNTLAMEVRDHAVLLWPD